MTYYYLRDWPNPGKCPDVLRSVIANLLQTHVLLRKSITDLSYDQLWRRPTSEEYAIGNIILHVCGSEQGWIHGWLGERSVCRDRDKEFSTVQGPSLDELFALLDQTEKVTLDVVTGLDDNLDVRELRFKKGEFSAEFILHYTAQHLAYHAGQLLTLRRLVESGYELH